MACFYNQENAELHAAICELMKETQSEPLQLEQVMNDLEVTNVRAGAAQLEFWFAREKRRADELCGSVERRLHASDEDDEYAYSPLIGSDIAELSAEELATEVEKEKVRKLIKDNKFLKRENQMLTAMLKQKDKELAQTRRPRRQAHISDRYVPSAKSPNPHFG